MTTPDLSPRPCGCVIRTRDMLVHRACEAHISNVGRLLGTKQIGVDVPRCDVDALTMRAAQRGQPLAYEVRLAIAEHVATFTREKNLGE